MGKKLIHNEVLERFKKVHGDKYDYSLVEYIFESKKVKIICKNGHGDFTMTPKDHFRGRGCPDCGEITGVEMRSNGEIIAACAIEGCNGAGAPGEKCSICGTRISSRVICNACNTSAPVGNHFSDEEAW